MNKMGLLDRLDDDADVADACGLHANTWHPCEVPSHHPEAWCNSLAPSSRAANPIRPLPEHGACGRTLSAEVGMPSW